MVGLRKGSESKKDHGAQCIAFAWARVEYAFFCARSRAASITELDDCLGD